ncbi:MAG: accessory factor UbiK family protein [Gammaproteobacteria bacterium]|nr:accessory factor UbiK family protein [Gammaproteobacteria bacterium]
MLDPKFFDDLAQRLYAALPDSARVLQQDVDRNVRAAVQAALNRLDLVTREEFEVQAKVLARTRTQLESLKQRVAQLETQVLGTRPASVMGQGTDQSADQDMDGG